MRNKANLQLQAKNEDLRLSPRQHKVLPETMECLPLIYRKERKYLEEDNTNTCSLMSEINREQPLNKHLFKTEIV